jgi:hypothetical protein
MVMKINHTANDEMRRRVLITIFVKLAIMRRKKFGLCAFMHRMNAHKIYQIGHDPTDKFYNFMCVYVHIKFIRAVRSFM